MSDQKTQSKHTTSTKDLKRVLGFCDLMAVSSVLLSVPASCLIGYGIGRTGRSIFIAFFTLIVVLARSSDFPNPRPASEAVITSWSGPLVRGGVALIP